LPDPAVTMNRWCPSCGIAWPAARVVCPDCLVELTEDPAATVRCRHCGREWPARMQSCPECLAELRVDPLVAADAVVRTLAAGGHLFRSDGPAFRAGPACNLLRLAPRGRLAFTDADGVVEATVDAPDLAALPPLTCHDLDGSVLFRLLDYEATEGALVALGADGAALGTYLRTVRGVDVRDETSAPVGHLRKVRGGHELVETGGGVVARCDVADVDQHGWIDDQWAFRPTARVPLRSLGVVGLVLAAKVFCGRALPSAAPRRGEPDDRPIPPWLG